MNDPYRPSHWPAWARDEVFTDTVVRFDWLDRLLIALGRPVSFNVRTVVEQPPGRCQSRSVVYAHRIRWPWRRQGGGYAEAAANATPEEGGESGPGRRANAPQP